MDIIFPIVLLLDMCGPPAISRKISKLAVKAI